MRNGTYYVQARVTPEEKAAFVKKAELCHTPEHTVLLHFLTGYTLAEQPPEEFWKLNSLLLRVTLLIGQIWLNKNTQSEKQKLKYYKAEHQLNKSYLSAFHKIRFADPNYGDGSNN